MIVRDAINYAHDLVVKCGRLDLPHKMEAHNAIDRIEAAYKSELQAHVKNFESTINNLVDENARLESANAKMREALKKIADSHGDLISWVSPDGRNLGAGVCTYAREVLAAEGGAK